MTEFKNGDLVVTVRRLHGDAYDRVAVGSFGTIIMAGVDGYYNIKFDDGATWYAEQNAIRHANKFKAGDRVRYKRDHTKQYTVESLKAECNMPAVVYTDGGWDFEDTLELVPQEKPNAKFAVGKPAKPHIVARVINGKPNPSTVPFVHSSLAGAQAEAERLANKTPGTTFEVYALVSRSVAETRTVIEPAKTEAV